MKKLQKLIIGLFIVSFCVLNFSAIKANDAELSEGEEYVIDPNTHYGFIRDFNNNCCKRRYHDDECKGTFC